MATAPRPASGSFVGYHAEDPMPPLTKADREFLAEMITQTVNAVVAASSQKKNSTIFNLIQIVLAVAVALGGAWVFSRNTVIEDERRHAAHEHAIDKLTERLNSIDKQDQIMNELDTLKKMLNGEHAIPRPVVRRPRKTSVLIPERFADSTIWHFRRASYD